MFSIRKLSLGACSVLIGALLFAGSDTVLAQTEASGSSTELANSGTASDEEPFTRQELQAMLEQYRTNFEQVRDRYTPASQSAFLSLLEEVGQLVQRETATAEEVLAAANRLADGTRSLVLKSGQSLSKKEMLAQSLVVLTQLDRASYTSESFERLSQVMAEA